MKLRKRSFGLWLGAWLLLPVSVMASAVLPYENKEAGVKLKYPADWIKAENLPGTLVGFGVPKEKANLKMVENVLLTVDNNLPAEAATLEKYTKMYEEQRQKDAIAPRLLESKKTKLGGLPAQSIVCAGKQKGMDIKFWQIWTVKDGKAYLFTYGASKETYPKFLKEAERIVASFTLVKPSAPKKVSGN